MDEGWIGLGIATIGVGVSIAIPMFINMSTLMKKIVGGSGILLILVGVGVILSSFGVKFRSPVFLKDASTNVTPPATVKDETAASFSSSPTVSCSNPPLDARSGPVGPIMAIEFVQTFSRLPKPCNIRITHTKDNENLGGVFSWLLTYGSLSDGSVGGAICNVDRNPILPPPNIDEDAPPTPTTRSGIIVHLSKDHLRGDQVTNFLDTSGFKVNISHRLPDKSSPNLIWIDIGPGDPWKEKR